MEMGRFEMEVSDPFLIEAGSHILQEPIEGIFQICERYGTEPEEVRRYDVYSLVCASGKKILKKAARREADNYERYLSHGAFHVPAYEGQYEDKDRDAVWLVLEKIDGDDLRDMTDELALLAAETIADIQNAYWGCEDTDRYQAYWERVNRRYRFIRDEPVIGEAYKIFLERQQTCPRTLSHGDFLQFNVVSRGDRVFAVDWGFGGVMPYALDLARFIAHGTEDRVSFPFYMNIHQKGLFVRQVYDRLRQKPDHAQYIRDIRLAVLNEYVEFMEADEDEDGWYAAHARALAAEILREGGESGGTQRMESV